MITTETAEQIATRNQNLEKLNRCLGKIERLSSATLEVSFRAPDKAYRWETEIFQIPNPELITLLMEAKRREVDMLDNLNYLAVQEAQDQDAGK